MGSRTVRSTFIAFAIVAAACNAAGATPLPTRTPTPTSPPATATRSISTPAELRGTWTAEVDGTSASSGLWVLTVSDTNLSLQNPIGGDPFTLDPVSMTATSLVLPAASDCPDQSVVTPGTYTVALTGGHLVFTVISDSCGDRSATLTTTPWTRKS